MPSGFVKIHLKQDGSAQPLFINQAFCDMTGMTVEKCMEIYQEDSFAGVHPDDLPGMHEIAQSFRVGDTVSYTLRLKKEETEWIGVRITTAVREENGETMLYNSYLDISSQQENQFMMDRLLNELPGGVAIFKIDQRIECTFFNDGFATLSGRSRQELEDTFQSTGFFENIVFPADVPTVKEKIENNVVKGEPINITYRFLCKNGEMKWLHLNASKLREEAGVPVYYCVFTEPSRQNLLYQSIADESSVGILVSDEGNHEIYYINRAFRELMHITDEHYSNKKCYEYIKGKSCVCENCNTAELSKGETKEVIWYDLEYDSYIRMRIMLVNWLGRTALVKYASDVTETYKKQLQQQALIDSVPSGVGIYEINHGVIHQVYMNDYYYHMIGESREVREKKIEKSILNVVHPDDYQAIEKVVGELRVEDDVRYVDFRIMCGNGEYRWFRIAVSVSKREGDTLTIYCNYTDMDEIISAKRS